TYIGFDTNTQSFAFQQYDRNVLTRIGPGSYQLLSGDGSRMIFSQSDGSSGSTRNIFLTEEMDPQGNALTFDYDTNFCLTRITDAIGQVTTLTYGLASSNIQSGPVVSVVPADPYKLTKVTDPFGRFATLNYEPQLIGEVITASSTNLIYGWGLASITDEIGITSQFGYYSVETRTSPVIYQDGNFVDSLTTPYGTTYFSTNADNGTTRSMEITYPDGSRERVEYNQGNTNQSNFDPASAIPTGMLTTDGLLQYRDTYYWDREACAMANGDYSKARLYHFLHTESLGLTAGAVESMKPPLEGRVWYDYSGQSSSVVIAPSTLPAHIGRVLDDGTTQLYTYGYNAFGHVTNSIDPLGRTLSFLYDTNGIDLLEVRQTRGGNNELLAKMAYNSQHLPVTLIDAAGQATKCSYNARGQMLS
ncbi:MAG: hypothetical protein ACREIC_04225, partial [Limisphaerales bacterium]